MDNWYETLERDRNELGSKWMRKGEFVLNYEYSPEPFDFIANPGSYGFNLKLELYRLYDNEVRIEFIWELPSLNDRNSYLNHLNFLDEPPETGYMGAMYKKEAQNSEPLLVFFLSEFETVRLVSSLPLPKHVTGSKGDLKPLLLDFLI
ncbi:hypothetical protein [Leptospira santarosai]|uniref:hypothetical protein n=1 Tax=Leptospira santarosai TaxID=28183 RepID=UPI001F34355B|nr:hypothetical protein [Leptospira santarosai]